MSLKRPVTLPQARRWPAAAKRRESFCARMGGMRRVLTGEEAARDPDSPINRALAAWDCDKPALLQRKQVSKGIRPMKITQSKVGAEARKPARKTARKNPEMVRKIGKFYVRYLPAGRDSKIEFYDPRYIFKDGFGELGQFITRYYARDILESPTGPLALDLGIPEWSITAAEKEKVREMIARSGDFGPVLNPARKTAAKNPRRRMTQAQKVDPFQGSDRLEGYGPRKGLEGPFLMRNGRVVYYDSAEGAYYDPKTDFYLSMDEAIALSESPARKNPAKPKGVKFINEAKADKKDDPTWIGYAVQKATGGGAYAIFESKAGAVEYARELANKMSRQMAVVRIRYAVQQ